MVTVDDLAATIDFFPELGLALEGRATIEENGQTCHWITATHSSADEK